MLELRQDRSLRKERLKRPSNKSLQVLQSKKGTEIVKFHVEHGKKLKMLPELTNIPLEALAGYAAAPTSYTALLNGKPIAAAGLTIETGRGHAWGFISNQARAMPFLLHRTVSLLLRNLILRHHLRRVDAIVHCEQPKWVDWAERLGFEYEGTMRNFYPDGKSAFFMARYSGGSR